MARMVLPGLERAKDVAETAKKNIPMIALIVVILLSMVAGVIFFHGVQIKDSYSTQYPYSKDWFKEFDQSHPPPDLLDLLKPEHPQRPPIEWPNASGIVFEVEGDASFYAWRYMVMDLYLEGYGWESVNDTREQYIPQRGGTVYFTVWKRNVEIAGKDTIRLITLWMPTGGIAGGSIAIGAVNVKANATVFTYLETGKKNKELFLTLYSQAQYAVANISYPVQGIDLDEDYLSTTSATIQETFDVVVAEPSLAYFLITPPDYLSRHPNVKDYLQQLNATIDRGTTTVYEAVAIVANKLLSDTSVLPWTEEATGDPVDRFISTKQGSLIDYIYTVALFLRYLGIPSRVIVGFAGGFYNSTKGVTEISATDITMWIEAYDKNLGWIPFNVNPFLGNMKNLADVLFQVSIYIVTYNPGGGSTYLDSNMTIRVEVSGAGVSTLIGVNVSIYDLNISDTTPLFNLTLQPYEAGVLAANITTSYEVIYNMLGVSPEYGLHIVEARVWGLSDWAIVYLVRQSQIT